MEHTEAVQLQLPDPQGTNPFIFSSNPQNRVKMAPSESSDETIILIGPEGAGKSTIGKLLAEALRKDLYSLDRHRDELYAPYNYDASLAEKIYEEQGLWAFYQHWSKFEYLAVEHILQHASREGDKFHGKILDFGAGHSVYEKPDELVRVEGLMRPFKNVVLVLPCDDHDEALKITESRRSKELGLNKHFLGHVSNGRLAKHVVYTKDATADECAKSVLEMISGKKHHMGL